MNFNPPYYQQLLENYGFKPFFYQLCFGLDPKKPLNTKIIQRHAALAADPAYSARMIEKKRLEKYADDFRKMYPQLSNKNQTMLVPFLLNKIPYASLAAILLITGYNLSKPKLFLNMWSLGWKQFIPFVLTIIVILSTDLLIGVSIGLLISIYFIVQNNFKAEYKITKTTINGIDTEYIKLNSNVTFLNKVKLRKALDEVSEYGVLTIDGSECNFIDYDILEIISEYENKARDRGIELHLKGIEKVNVTAVH